MKQEHQVEIAFLQKEYATVQNKAKILSKERDELVDAYKGKRLSNGNLEASLEELVNVLGIVAGGVEALVVLARDVGKCVLDKEVHGPGSSRK